MGKEETEGLELGSEILVVKRWDCDISAAAAAAAGSGTCCSPTPPSPRPHDHELDLEGRKVMKLSVLDIPWLMFPPTQPLFLYAYPHSLSHFTSTALPHLQRSLSLSLLHHSLPLTSRLLLRSSPDSKPFLVLDRRVSITLAVAPPHLFTHLCAHDSRPASLLHPLVPPYNNHSDSASAAVLAVQVTVFPNSGICIGLTCHRVVADARSLNLFLKSWAFFSRISHSGDSTLTSGTVVGPLCPLSPSPPPPPPPYYDRTVIRDPGRLEQRFLEEWRRWKEAHSPETDIHVDVSDVVRSTFVVGPPDMDLIKRWIIAQCEQKTDLSRPRHLSPYVLTCSLLWVSWVTMKTHPSVPAHQYERPPTAYFGFIAGGITRLGYPVPAAYFGNCVGFGRAEAAVDRLVGEHGLVIAAHAIGETIKRLDSDLLGSAERWISDWKVFSEHEIHLMVAGSPKVDLYSTDFGWGRPNKIEDVSIDGVGGGRRAVSLLESRDVEGGIEVGLALPKPEMEVFTSLFSNRCCNVY